MSKIAMHQLTPEIYNKLQDLKLEDLKTAAKRKQNSTRLPRYVLPLLHLDFLSTNMNVIPEVHFQNQLNS